MEGVSESNPGNGYLIKRLGMQEMGSRRERDARASRGRYVLIPKTALDMFPPHSGEKLNDHAFIGLSPLFSRGDGEPPKKTYFIYVYHNSAVAEGDPGGRNEHRIYLSKNWDAGEMFGGDILVIRRKRPDELQSLDLVKEDLVSPHDVWDYWVDWIRRDRNEAEWCIYDQLISARAEGQNKTSICVPERLEIFEKKVARSADLKTEIDERIIRSCREGSQENDSLFSEQSFRDFVLSAYGYDCAVSHEAVIVGPHSNLETVRIRPLNEGGRLTPRNGVALRTDLAWAFRRGMFTIEPVTRRVRVHDAVKNTYLGNYEGRTVGVKKPVFEPHDFFLKYHAEHVFGRFLPM